MSMEHGLHDEERLSHKAFLLDQEKRNEAVEGELRKRMEGKARLYFEFKTPEQRDAAIVLINEMRAEHKDYHDAFVYFEGCGINESNSDKKDVGIEIRFSRDQPHLIEYFDKILREANIQPKREDETIDGVPIPDRTRIY